MTQPLSFSLDPSSGKSAPDDLLSFLNENKTCAIQIDVSQVASISGRQIELLLSAYKQWRDAGLPFALTDVADPVAQQLAAIGVPAQLFSEGK